MPKEILRIIQMVFVVLHIVGAMQECTITREDIKTLLQLTEVLIKKLIT